MSYTTWSRCPLYHTPRGAVLHNVIHHVDPLSILPYTTWSRCPSCHTPRGAVVHYTIHHVDPLSIIPHTTWSRCPLCHTPRGADVHYTKHHVEHLTIIPCTTWKFLHYTIHHALMVNKIKYFWALVHHSQVFYEIGPFSFTLRLILRYLLLQSQGNWKYEELNIYPPPPPMFAILECTSIHWTTESWTQGMATHINDNNIIYTLIWRHIQP